MKRFRGVLVVLVLIGVVVATETVAYRRVVPTGRVANIGDYLRWQPTRQRFAQVQAHGESKIIAYGPKSSWLLLPSGSSAYVFDATGRLEDWSKDIGDDPAFDQRWNAQRSIADAAVSRAEVERRFVRESAR